MPTTHSSSFPTQTTPASGPLPFRVSRFAFRISSSAFTLTELMVSITILVVIILSVGVIFGNASRAVGTSQSLMEMLANVRAVQQVVERDVAGIDKNSFLVIRSRYLFAAPLQQVRYDSVTGLTTPYNTPSDPPGLGYRCDQVSFISLGTFPNRTGSAQTAPTFAPFADSTVGNAAHVWIGQLVMEHFNSPDYLTPSQGTSFPQIQLPTGVSNGGLRENEFTLGIHHTLMLPGKEPADASNQITPSGNVVMAYPSIRFDTLPITGAGETTSAHITSSRFAVCAKTPAQFMASISPVPVIADSNWDLLCYRFKSLYSVNDTDAVCLSPFVNACFRMHPIALQGTSSFKVEWTLGEFNAGNQVWYSPENTYPNLLPPDTSINSVDPSGATLNGDYYIAAFSPNNRARWPKALRFTYHVVDPNKRLQGGRDFVQIVKLPD